MQFLFNQTDLPRICRDRTLRTKEIHPTNDFYGQATVLKRYAGLPRRYSLKAVLEHAPVLHDEMWKQDRENCLPVNFSCSHWRTQVMKKHSGRPTYPIGFGFLYARAIVQQMLAKQGIESQRRGTIVFPFKSTHMIDTNFDHEDYANRLAALPEKMQSVSICIFWKDFLRGVHIPYQKKGIGILSAGHMYDADFMLRLYDICRQFKFAVSNEFGTHVLLTAASGCRFAYYQSSEITRAIPAGEINNYVQDNAGFQSIRRESKKLFTELGGQYTPDQRNFVDEFLGERYFRSPGELRKMILQSELKDKLVPSRNHSRAFVLPPAWPRSWHRLKTKIGKRLSRKQDTADQPMETTPFEKVTRKVA